MARDADVEVALQHVNILRRKRHRPVYLICGLRRMNVRSGDTDVAGELWEGRCSLNRVSPVTCAMYASVLIARKRSATA